MIALWYGTVLCVNTAQEKKKCLSSSSYFSATLPFIITLVPLVCMIGVVVSCNWLFKHSKAIARELKMLRAKVCGRYNSEYKILDSGNHATAVPHA